MRLGYKRYIIFFIGISILTLGVSLTVKSDIGAGSYDSINFALSYKLNLSVGITISLTSLFIAFLAAIVRKSKIRLTTFITSIVIGIFTDFWVGIISYISVNETFMKIIIFLIGSILVCLGLAIYVSSNLPTTPVDDFMVALTEKKGLSLGVSKLFIDVVCIIFSFLLDGPIGIGTIILTLLVGPGAQTFHSIINNFYNERVQEQIN